MDMLVFENEEVHDLNLKGLKIIQSKSGFRFGMDAVLLSDFAKDMKPKLRVMDLCAGNGIISILLSGKVETTSITAVEIQEDVASLARRSVVLNGLEDKIDVLCSDLKDLDKLYTTCCFDAIVTNPPYKKLDTGLRNSSDTKFLARHEVTCSLDDVARVSSFLLRPLGALYMVHRPERLCEIISCLQRYHLEPKLLRFVQPTADKAPNLLLIKAVKQARPFLKLENTLVVYGEDGNYTQEFLDIYNK